eukprot:TRINITY_DN590_c0_g1_i1.p1 TRINITY_DN590_c0_g1~~TRINITY_DN590_c0_g1_i1.p1  ORF type:complete len:159 (-),score=32.79 TRINITY_DN590_c0_g1_i1:142-618(-)
MGDSVEIVSLKPRPWAEFLDSTAFSMPKDLPAIKERILSNTNFYLGNYASVVAFAVAYTLLTHPALLMSVVLIGASGGYLFFVRQPSSTPIVVGGQRLDENQLRMGFAAGSVILLLLSGSLSAIMAIYWALLACSIHSIFRKRNLANRFAFVKEALDA